MAQYTGLRAAVRAAKMTIRELAAESRVAESTLHYWARNGIPRKERTRLARIIGCDEQELSHNYHKAQLQGNRMVYEKMDDFFTFGKITTQEIILDGDGIGVYLPEHIHAHYIPVALELPNEFRMRKEQIALEQEVNKAEGGAYQWNGERYNLARFAISRDPAHEDMTLGLWFRPSDYYTFLATSTGLQESALREKYLADAEWDEAIPLFAHSFSVLLTVITSDGYAILVRRGKGLGCRPNVYDTSMAEGLSRSLDRSATGQAPDIYRCAVRGLSEELGLNAPDDYSPANIHFLSFAVDTEYCMYGLFGMVRIQRSLEEMRARKRHGIQDKWENREVYYLPFTPEEVCMFVSEREPFSPGGLVCLYHTLVHEHGRKHVDSVLAAT